MFSKPLFKQSIKANGLMWAIVTAMVCFMLACVMTISGSGSIGQVADGVTDTIVTNSIEAAIKDGSLTVYSYSQDGETSFDSYFLDEFNKEKTSLGTYYAKIGTWVVTLKNSSSTGIPDCYGNKDSMPKPDEDSSTQKTLYSAFLSWCESEPLATSFDLTTPEGLKNYQDAITSWSGKMPSSTLVAALSATPSYVAAISSLKEHALEETKKVNAEATEKSDEYSEILGSYMVTINPNNLFDAYYTDNSLKVPDSYDVTSLIQHDIGGDAATYLVSSERIDYRNERASGGSSVFFASLFTSDAAKAKMIVALNEYGVSEEKYDSFGYDFVTINHLANTTIASYQARYEYEMSVLKDDYEAGKYADEAAYEKAIADKKENLRKDVSSSFLSSLPQEVSDAIKEVGQMDVYSLIVGSVYFKMAGLLLPIIYVIMTANNLVSSQVDSGSMAYILSTSTKRSTVTFTQACYLILSILGLCLCTTITSFICFASVHLTKTSLDYGKLALMNLGSFGVLFALGGLNFFTSCFFDRQKRSMSIGGGISIFSLVATMLGLFGSKEIPSIVRFSSLNYFNYASIISLFDVPSIVNGSSDYIWKLAILFVLGLIGYVAGSISFKKKDLPL